MEEILRQREESLNRRKNTLERFLGKDFGSKAMDIFLPTTSVNLFPNPPSYLEATQNFRWGIELSNLGQSIGMWPGIVGLAMLMGTLGENPATIPLLLVGGSLYLPGIGVKSVKYYQVYREARGLLEEVDTELDQTGRTRMAFRKKMS